MDNVAVGSPHADSQDHTGNGSDCNGEEQAVGENVGGGSASSANATWTEDVVVRQPAKSGEIQGMVGVARKGANGNRLRDYYNDEPPNPSNASKITLISPSLLNGQKKVPCQRKVAHGTRQEPDGGHVRRDAAGGGIANRKGWSIWSVGRIQKSAQHGTS